MGEAAEGAEPGGERTARLARNEALFRTVNESVADALRGSDPSLHSEFACECARINCTREVVLSLDEYRDVRSEDTWFLVFPGHSLENIERVVRRSERFEVVEKTVSPGLEIAKSRA